VSRYAAIISTGRYIPAFNTERWPKLIHQVLSGAGMTPADVALFILTQLNLRTIEATMAKLDLPMSKTHWTKDKWGYIGSACIPATLDDAVELGRLCSGDHVVFCATGGGLALACALLRWTL
jgi:3-oxoacyl-[acyl-carrier-protein] synthase-3